VSAGTEVFSQRNPKISSSFPSYEDRPERLILRSCGISISGENTGDKLKRRAPIYSRRVGPEGRSLPRSSRTWRAPISRFGSRSGAGRIENDAGRPTGFVASHQRARQERPQHRRSMCGNRSNWCTRQRRPFLIWSARSCWRRTPSTFCSVVIPVHSAGPQAH